MEKTGKKMKCPHCKCKDFNHRRAQLNTALATMLELDALNESADVYVCRQCGHLQWFVGPDKDHLIENAPKIAGAPAVGCPKCNLIVPEEISLCVCGWSRQPPSEEPEGDGPYR